MRALSRRFRFHPVVNLLIGAVLGFLVASNFRSFITYKISSECVHRLNKLPGKREYVRSESLQYFNKRYTSHQNPENTLLFIGVMTAQKYLENRALAIYRTWGQTVPGKVIFFSSAISRASSNIPLVPLPGVDDSYPPQKKSFLMLKYMHDHYLDKFEWFMRADDDVYIRMDRLEKLLRSVNSSKPLFIGQAGMGKEEEFGQLNLEPDDNFCMGGPGIIMSRTTLQLLVPHIRYCLKHLYSTHEDVEIGRCVKKFVGIPCTWSYEMQSIFYHSFNGEGIFTGRLKVKDIHRAITLHPIKQPLYLYRLHYYFLGLQSQDLRHRILHLYRNLYDAMYYLNELSPIPSVMPSNISTLGLKPQLNKSRPNSSEEILVWDFVAKNIYSAYSLNPKRRIELSLQTALNDTIMEIMEMINKFSKQRGRVIDFKELLYGYIRVNPVYGIDYVLDMLLTYKKYRGKKMTVPVRRHAYLQQAFSEPEIREIGPNEFESFIEYRGSNIDSGSTDTVIHFILPLSGRVKIFKRFLLNFEEVCLKLHESVELAVILFSSGSMEDAAETKVAFRDLQTRYPNYHLRLVEATGAFSRALALEIGAKLYSLNSLLFFVDVDIMLENTVLQRVRLNTIKGKQAYFPIVFSEYDPTFIAGTFEDHYTAFIDEERGYWRQFGFGIVSLYHEDLQEVGGLDTAIQGWGKEDVDLYNKIVHSNITVFRAVDPGLRHVFHPIECSQQLDKPQFDMCLGSKYSSLASVKRLAELVIKNLDLYLKTWR